MNEELINSIVQRILSDPDLQRLLESAQAETTTVKPNCLILLNFVPDIERVLKEINTRWGADNTLTILPSDSMLALKPNLPNGMSWITPQEALTNADWQKMIIPTCSPNTLAKVALGIRDNPICEMVGRGISQGIPIELGTEYLGLTSQTPQAYQKLYEGYLQQVKLYGINVFTTLTSHHIAVTNKSLIVKNIGQAVRKPEIIRFDKKLLADKDAFSFPEKSMVIVEKATVISPLARDTLKLRQIELRQDREVNS